MKITFLGGTQTVTGSKFLVSSGDTQVLVDCGLFQGYKWLRERNWQGLPLDRERLDAVILSHAHLDHSGYLPLLYGEGYRGPVYAHPATCALCAILLPDSGHLQEEDARYYERHRLSKYAHPKPLYDHATAERCLELFRPLAFDQVLTLGPMRIHLHPVGHILGAGAVIIEAEGKRIAFSGDVGRPDDLFMYPPRPLPELDLLMLESTYGNRRHSDQEPFQQLARVVNDTARDGGVLLIPSFAVGRAQTLQHMLVTLMADGRIPTLPIFLDSPMAIDVSDIYSRFHRLHRLDAADWRRMFDSVEYVRHVEDSKALSDQRYPHIIIAGSGMLTGGRILHHLKRHLNNHRTRVLLSGYQADGTRGAKLQQGVDAVKIHGEWIENRAQIASLHGLSGHGDYVDIQHWLADSALKPDTAIQLIHGDADALEGMRDHLRRFTRFQVEIAGYRNILTL